MICGMAFDSIFLFLFFLFFSFYFFSLMSLGLYGRDPFLQSYRCYLLKYTFSFVRLLHERLHNMDPFFPSPYVVGFLLLFLYGFRLFFDLSFRGLSFG